MFTLVIGNKNYSSWSLRSWLLLRALEIPFEERLEAFTNHGSYEAFRSFSPTGRVPCLIDGDIAVWDSLAIAEYVAETYPQVWPHDRAMRAFARSIAAEMHSGFMVLRNVCTMNCGLRVELHDRPLNLEAELRRINEIWKDGLQRFGGPFLAGERFSAADAFYAPVAFRLQTYGISLSPDSDAYADRLRHLPAMKEWYHSAIMEEWREPDHEAEAVAAGRIVSDFRSRKPASIS
ncbi:glutathione S-transferase family protein [Mesorhizobium sp. SB112]|uniref:glutathione S-transferase family protein n=1 Tax=Mesorhizobium sp. SB112 TaxID=3151853 RepID=UPI0032663D36